MDDVGREESGWGESERRCGWGQVGRAWGAGGIWRNLKRLEV